MARRPSLEDLYEGRVSIPGTRRRSRGRSALLGALRGASQSMGTQVDKPLSRDQPIVPSGVEADPPTQGIDPNLFKKLQPEKGPRRRTLKMR